MILFSFWESGNLHSLLLQCIREKDVLISFEVKLEPLKNSSWTSRVSVFQRNWSHRVLHRDEIYYKKLAHTTVEADKSEICRAGQQVGDSGRLGTHGELMLQVESEAIWRQTSLFLGEFFFFLMASNWWDEAHPHYGGQSVLFKVSWL